jgi:hypothetical protein
MVAMPNRVKVVVVISALALAAGLLALALGAKPTQAQAETDTVNVRTPLEGTFVNPCTEEEFTFEGTAHEVLHSTVNASGGFLFMVHGNFQVQGESASGAKYVVHQSEASTFVLSEAADNFTATRNLQFIRVGSATPEEEFVIKQVVHFTINANGEATSDVVEETVECK